MSAKKYTKTQLEKMTRAELQSIAKAKEIPARQSRSALVAALTGTYPIAQSLGWSNQSIIDLPVNASGQAVNATTCLSLNACWSCVRLVSDHIATLGINLKQPQDTGGSKFITNDPRYLLTNKQPNPEQNKTDFWSEVIVSLLTTGNAFIEIVRDGAGRLQALYPLAAYLVTGWREADGIHYFVAGNPIEATDLLHIKYGVTYPNNIFSVSPITAQRQALGRMMAQEESMSSMWRNGMRPGGVISTPNVLSDKAKENLRQSISAGNTGTNQGRLMVLEEGLSYTPQGWSPLDVDFINQSNLNTVQIAAIFGVPPSMVGVPADKAATQEQDILYLVRHALSPVCGRIESELNFKLCQDNCFFRFSLDDLFNRSSNMADRSGVMSRLIQWSCISPNEARVMFLDLEPRTDPGADSLITPANWKTVSSPDPTAAPAADDIDKVLGLDSALSTPNPKGD